MSASSVNVYDPLVNPLPHHLALPDSYWASTQALPQPLPPLLGSHRAEIAVVGGGFSGLLTAYYLASHYGREVVLLEANRIGFGASARNGGFVLKGSGRLSYAQMAKRWDLDTAHGIYREFSEAVSRVEELISSGNIDCEPQEKGYIKVAHNPAAMETLKAGAEFIRKYFGGDAEFLSAAELRSQLLDHHQAFGALRLPDGFGLNPLKLLLGYRKLALDAGVRIYENSCVISQRREQGRYLLTTDGGELSAAQLVMSGNAYTPKHFSPLLDKRFLPILSNVIVTEPLTEDERLAAGMHSRQVTMDTRILKYYYRLLPDNRLLFGGRGAVWGKDEHRPEYPARLKQALNSAFPALTSKQVDYRWSGWIAASMDDMPHVYSQDGCGYTMGYCGAGVSFSAQAAWRLAGMLSGVAAPALPLYQSPLPTFPFAAARRLGQWGYYHYGRLRDAIG
ncbi:NAD(P)/FAD-dependent oxidoreductase [Shewanella cyperi]|uniref:NAD(P)/FAD-dependent oxidoreductase n=1 Tax=Shewanella cyperi TaxID=2814292 RepID=UPI001A94B4A6|nr:FAD-binding oxidoreductase [Shewanella cyperi]QSX41762.1 FAD-binding oxidoreductase [Shewanella cyperi]